MKYLPQIGFLVAHFLLSSVSLAWSGQTDCSYLQPENQTGVRYAVKYTIMATTGGDAYKKILQVMSSAGPVGVFYQEGRNPTPETVRLSDVSLLPSDPSFGGPVSIRVLEAPRDVTVVDQKNGYLTTLFYQKISVRGSTFSIDELDLYCDTFETVEEH